jgi:pimeloyl-ACP methyl ester carboxylesterase
VPTLELSHSPHAPGISPVTIHYREFGAGNPLIFLHGGWGYGVYPFDAQIEALKSQFRILIPDRSGYGHSTHVAEDMPLDFHRRAAEETIAILDVLGIEKAAFWGHSDGSVISAMIGLSAPERCECVILEAFHLLKRKPGSRSFFERFAARPEDLGAETKKLLEADHGTDWPRVLQRNCRVWFRIADAVKSSGEDLYDGRLGELSVPTLFLHGRLDPRTEPGEMERVQREVPQARMRFVENGKHSPHSETDASSESTKLAMEFLRSLA